MKSPLKATVNLIKKSPFLPFRERLRQFYKKHIREKMYEDRIAETEIGGVKHRLDLSTYAGMEAYFGNWEPAIVKIVEQYVRPGMTAMEVGASIGLHTFRLKKLVGDSGKVFAVDPKKSAFEALEKTAKLNNYSVANHLYLDKVMLSDETVAREMKLDDFVKAKNISKFDFILMDLDGGELRVIKGGMKTLKEFKPMLMLEIHPSHLGPEGTEKLIDLLSSCGYSFFEGNTLKRYPNKQSFTEEAITKKTLYTFCK